MPIVLRCDTCKFLEPSDSTCRLEVPIPILTVVTKLTKPDGTEWKNKKDDGGAILSKEEVYVGVHPVVADDYYCWKWES